MVITCTNDQEAIAQAKQMFDGHDLEVWQKARFVTGLSLRRNRESWHWGTGSLGGPRARRRCARQLFCVASSAITRRHVSTIVLELSYFAQMYESTRLIVISAGRFPSPPDPRAPVPVCIRLTRSWNPSLWPQVVVFSLAAWRQFAHG